MFSLGTQTRKFNLTSIKAKSCMVNYSHVRKTFFLKSNWPVANVCYMLETEMKKP